MRINVVFRVEVESKEEKRGIPRIVKRRLIWGLALTTVKAGSRITALTLNV